MDAVFDFGLSNLKFASANAGGVLTGFSTQPARGIASVETILAARAAETAWRRVIVTGGQSGRLPDVIEGIPVVKVSEIDAIGQGGLALANQDAGIALRKALVVGCGTGTGMYAVRAKSVRHSSGTAVGGGTLLGMARLLLGTIAPGEIDALALTGVAANVDLTLSEVTGGNYGLLPADATAVNFGRLARDGSAARSRADIASALSTLVAQTIALIAINAARFEKLDTIVLVGNLTQMASIRAQLMRTASFYGAKFVIPANGGYAGVIGAHALSRRGSR